MDITQIANAADHAKVRAVLAPLRKFANRAVVGTNQLTATTQPCAVIALELFSARPAGHALAALG
jgi:hypothetical protein